MRFLGRWLEVNALRQALLGNPLLRDRSYLLRRLIGGSHTGRRTLFYVLGGFVLLLLVVLAAAFPGFITPRGILLTQTFLMAFLVPTLVYPSIATEREKRSWDMLRVCPLSNAQIVLGKYMVAMLFVVFVATLFLIPCQISELASASLVRSSYSYEINNRLSFGEFAGAEVYSLIFGAGIGALSMWISARAKRGFSALLTILAILSVLLLFVPLLLSSLGLNPSQQLGIYFWHPLILLNYIGAIDYWGPDDATLSGSFEPTSFPWEGPLFFGVLFWGAMTALFLWMATLAVAIDEDSAPRNTKSHA